MNEQVRFVPNDHTFDDLALKAALEAMAEGSEVEDAVIVRLDDGPEE